MRQLVAVHGYKDGCTNVILGIALHRSDGNFQKRQNRNGYCVDFTLIIIRLYQIVRHRCTSPRFGNVRSSGLNLVNGVVARVMVGIFWPNNINVNEIFRYADTPKRRRCGNWKENLRKKETTFTRVYTRPENTRFSPDNGVYALNWFNSHFSRVRKLHANTQHSVHYL